MPYASISDLPAEIRDALPVGALEIYRAVFNDAYAADCGDACAAKQAWAAVKRVYAKKGDEWVKIENSAPPERRHETVLQRLGVYHTNNGRKVFYTPESFANFTDWSGVPVIYADVSVLGGVLRHPDFGAVDAKTLPPGYTFVGTVANPALPSAGEPRLVADLNIDDPAVEKRIAVGEVSISTAFSGMHMKNADESWSITGNVKPNHVLVFDRGVCPNCYSNDYGAVFLNCEEDQEMDEESKGILKKIADALGALKPSQETPMTNAAPAVDPQVETLTAENAKLTEELGKIRVAAEQEKRDTQWAAMKNSVPAGWLGEKEAETRKEFETDAGAFALKLVAHNAQFANAAQPAQGNQNGVAAPPETIEAANAQAAKEISEFETTYGFHFVD